MFRELDSKRCGKQQIKEHELLAWRRKTLERGGGGETCYGGCIPIVARLSIKGHIYFGTLREQDQNQWVVPGKQTFEQHLNTFYRLDTVLSFNITG